MPRPVFDELWTVLVGMLRDGGGFASRELTGRTLWWCPACQPRGFRVGDDHPMAPLYALNLFDLAPNDDYKAYSRRSIDAVGKHGGELVALGRLAGAPVSDGAQPRQVMALVQWPNPEAFEAFRSDPDLEDLHPLRENGTENYLWWTYDKLEDLRSLLNPG